MDKTKLLIGGIILLSIIVFLSLRTQMERDETLSNGVVEADPIICDKRIPVETDSLIYFQQVLEVDSGGYNVLFDYPIFGKQEKELNSLINMELFDSLSNEENYFRENYGEYLSEMNTMHRKGRYNWRDEESIIVSFNTSEIISFEHADYEWKTGGAIGFGRTSGINFDRGSGEIIELDDVLNLNDELILEGKLLKVYNAKYDSIQSIVLKDNFLIQEDGIVFIYNRFEDVPFATGLRLLVSYCDLEDLILNNSILERVIEK